LPSRISCIDTNGNDTFSPVGHSQCSTCSVATVSPSTIIVLIVCDRPASGSRPRRRRAAICSGPRATSSGGVGMSVYSPSAAKNAPTPSKSRS
jgi:hypothetical protein